MKLSGSTVVITGAARGLGLACARRLVEEGANIALIDFDAARLHEACTQLQRQGASVHPLSLDITHEDDVVLAFERIVETFGVIHGLVNCAGIIRDGLLVRANNGHVEGTLSLSDFRAVLDTNLMGSFLCGREAARHMVSAGVSGCIVNVTSISQVGNFGQSNYSAAKAGLQAMTVAWAKELAVHGIRAVALAPGFIKTEILDGMNSMALEKLSMRIPLKRFGLPDEISHTVKYILENEYLTGRCIELDGGLRF